MVSCLFQIVVVLLLAGIAYQLSELRNDLSRLTDHRIALILKRLNELAGRDRDDKKDE